jgi:hypothetical protein
MSLHEYPLSPTEELIMEVLAGRYRLGETQWPFASNRTSSRSAGRLEERGLVHRQLGQVEHTFRLSLTEQGIKERDLDKPYTPPAYPTNKTQNTLTAADVGGISLPSTFSGTGHPVARTTKTRADDWKSGFDAGWVAREGQPR